MERINWDEDNILWIANNIPEELETLDEKKLRDAIEPWLTAVFQSEHLSLLLGTGITTAVVKKADENPRAMERVEIETCKNEIQSFAESEAKKIGRGKANFEDDLRTAIELLKGLEILNDPRSSDLREEINEQLRELIVSLIENETKVIQSDKGNDALLLLKRFLISFSSRTATRDRLHIFTTNYDRFIEYALDLAGIHILDRFVGKLNPVLRMHKMELDYHYNPPGIRGEPRYVEGVVRYTKLHGSLDWKFEKNEIVREPIPFGIEFDKRKLSDPFGTKVIYPNASKAVETAYFPYSELFRDFSTATCKPNSVLVTYGYGFGDSHINAIIQDMMTIPSTHLVIISFDTADGRIKEFVQNCNPSQITLLIGSCFGDLEKLVENYLPKSAIDRISDRRHKIVEKRSLINNESGDGDYVRL